MAPRNSENVGGVNVIVVGGGGLLVVMVGWRDVGVGVVMVPGDCGSDSGGGCCDDGAW